VAASQEHHGNGGAQAHRGAFGVNASFSLLSAA
jgi:hypothetical protein